MLGHSPGIRCRPGNDEVQSPPPAQFRRSRIRVRARIGFALLPPGVAPYAVASAADQACRRTASSDARQSLRRDDDRAVPIPQVDRVAPSGNPTWQGEHLGFFGCPRRVQLGDQRNLVAPEPTSFLIEPGGFGPGRVQFAAQLSIAALQYLKKPDVGQAFSMQMVTGPPGIGGLLSKHGRSGDPAFAPREGTGQDASGDRYRQPGTGHPDPAKTGSNGDGGRPDQREPRVTAQRGRFRNSGRDGGIHRPESSQGYPKFPEWSAAWRRRPCRDGECGTPVPGTRPPPPTRHWPPRQSPN